MTNENDHLDFQTTASIKTLKKRAEIIKTIRRFFDDQGFFEVETPVVSHDIVVDRYLEPVAIEGDQFGIAALSEKKLWLQTSPEFAMKRILASGADAVYQITKAFRAGEAGNRHNPEFTMLEWYRVGDDQEAGIKLLGHFFEAILDAPPAEPVSYRQVFRQYADLDPFTASVVEFEKTAIGHEIDVEFLKGNHDIDAWRNVLLTEIIEPQLGQTCPQIIFDWPASQSALAIVRDESPPVAERFECYYQGFELANGYHELLDADELLRRNELVNRQRMQDGKSTLPQHSQLIDAMKHGLPACSGVALGVDRLIMLATGQPQIRDVISFDIRNA